MSEDDKQQQNEQITQAGAVELDEASLEGASGGESVGVKIDPVGVKLDPSGFKLDPGGFKFDPGGTVGKKAF